MNNRCGFQWKRVWVAVLGVAVLHVAVLHGASAQAAVIFHEDFDGYAFTSARSGTYHIGHGRHSGAGSAPKRVDPGIPELGEGAAEIWHGARFAGYGGRATAIDADLGVWNSGRAHHRGTAKWRGSPAGMFEDNAGLVFRLDTAGTDEVTLGFAWSTHRAGRHSLLRAGYLTTDPGFGTCSGNGESGCFADLRTGAGAWDNWTELALAESAGKTGTRHRRSKDWVYEHFLLPAGESEIWVAFWLNGDDGAFGKIDNIMVTATPVPLPAGVWLLATAVAILASRVRRPVAAS